MCLYMCVGGRRWGEEHQLLEVPHVEPSQQDDSNEWSQHAFY